jgi:hypothetical protein
MHHDTRQELRRLSSNVSINTEPSIHIDDCVHVQPALRCVCVHTYDHFEPGLEFRAQAQQFFDVRHRTFSIHVFRPGKIGKACVQLFLV